MKTLREVCNEVKVTRRAVQGYEKAGLVAPSGHNERGFLLYDEKAQKHIEKIKMYQDMGFSIKEIKCIIDESNEMLKEMLSQRLVKLQEQKLNLERVIIMAEEIIEEL